MYIAPFSFAPTELGLVCDRDGYIHSAPPELTLLNRCNLRNLQMALSSRATPSLAVGLLPLLC